VVVLEELEVIMERLEGLEELVQVDFLTPMAVAVLVAA
jgi:hypothetical protein